MSWGVYAHVPWCRVRCPYCAFDIVPRATPEAERWLAGVLADLQRWHPTFPGVPDTLYVGGGTPSRLPAATLVQLVEAVGARDVTVEANPEDLTQAWLDALIEGGVTRISLGVQSTRAEHARRLGRAHTPVGPAIRRLQASGLQSWSVDLIFGLPGQSIVDLERDLDALLAWEPPHVSLYGLTIEPGTGFASLQERGHMMEADPDVWREMYDLLVRRLRQAGLERYEVSNFARDRHRSAHNELYWNNAPYLGIGPGAHGLAPDGRRWVNASWAAWRSGEPPTIERPPPEVAAVDALVAGIRGAAGLPIAALAPFRPDPRVVGQLQAAGFLAPFPDRLVLTDVGVPVSDSVVRALADSLSIRPSQGSQGTGRGSAR